MTTITYSALEDLLTLLHNNWGGSGDAGREPIFQKVWERRSVGFGSDRQEVILLTPRQENIQYFGLHGDNFFHDLTVDLDIRSYHDEERHEVIVKEIIRIIQANIRGSTTFPYTDLRIMSSHSRSEIMRNMYNHIISVSYRKTDP
tara:strand:+ start:1850 stop:2284 length:435 start_codon:yes stop_codon:yes gene_type:complete